MYTTYENIFSSNPVLTKGKSVLHIGEVIRYLTPFWGWKLDPLNATILKIDQEDLRKIQFHR